MSARALRAEVGARGLERGEGLELEVGFGRVPSVVYVQGDDGGHGNFLKASYRRIVADAGWAARLGKAYTASARLPRAGDRWRGELECASSSDALLMNVFCYPGVLRRVGVCGLMGVEAGVRPEFGVRAGLAMRKDEVDRTELDMSLGDLLVEAKLTEGGFGRASTERLLRYQGVEEVVEIDELPRSGGQIAGYQIVRGVLAATRRGGRYLVLLDGRRGDLEEVCFRVLGAVRDGEVRRGFRLLRWQELAGVLPPVVQGFLATKYGILAG